MLGKNRAKLKKHLNLLNLLTDWVKRLIILGLMIYAFCFAWYQPFMYIPNIKIQTQGLWLTPQEISDIGAKPIHFFSAMDDLDLLFSDVSAIKQVEYRRDFPNALLIKVTAHQPIAKWEALESTYIAKDSTLFSNEFIKNDALPKLKGQEVHKQLLLKQLIFFEQQFKGQTIHSIELTPQNTWQVNTSINGLNHDFIFLQEANTQIAQKIATWQAIQKIWRIQGLHQTHCMFNFAYQRGFNVKYKQGNINTPVNAKIAPAL